LFASVILLAVNSCDKTESPTYDGGQSLAYFDGTTANLEVIINDKGVLNFPVGSSTVSDVDRTVNISLIEESTTADQQNFTFEPVVTIPAGEYFGEFTVTGIDNTVETTSEIISFQIDSFSGGVVSSEILEISMFQVCPIPSDYFVGSYLIEQISTEVDGPTLSTGTIVDVSIPDGSASQRVFETETYPNYCAGTFLVFPINLVCGEFIVPLTDTVCRCTDAEDWFGPALVPNGYTIDGGDDVLEVTFSDDRKSDCGPTAQTTYRFTKQ
jgi:hypothetical protein